MWSYWWQCLYMTLGTQVKHVNHYTQVGSCQRRLTLIILLYFNLVTLKDASCTQLVVGFCYILIILQGCGNMAMLCLSPGKLSEKSYLSVRNPTCPVFSTFDTWKHSCECQCELFIQSIASWSVTELSVHNRNKSNWLHPV